MRRLAALAAVALLAGCGGGGKSSEQTLYSAPDWAVTLDHGKAEVQHRVNGKWVVDHSGAVKIEILGPRTGQLTSNPPQVAITMHSRTPIVESFLWVDGNRLFEKGGGTPTNYTLYGAPTVLTPGTHTAVGYARTAFGGSAVAWTFQVPK